MGKRKADAGQIEMDFDLLPVDVLPGGLAGLDSVISRAISTILHAEPRSREVICAEMSVAMDQDISRHMIDAYASPSREDHRVPASRLLALILITGRKDVLGQILRHIGLEVLDSAEIDLARAGHLRARMKQLQNELRTVEARIRPMERADQA